jgi:hypothetical protein
MFLVLLLWLCDMAHTGIAIESQDIIRCDDDHNDVRYHSSWFPPHPCTFSPDYQATSTRLPLKHNCEPFKSAVIPHHYDYTE